MQFLNIIPNIKEKFQTWLESRRARRIFFNNTNVRYYIKRSTALILGCFKIVDLPSGSKTIDAHGIKVFDETMFTNFDGAIKRATTSDHYDKILRKTQDLADELGDDLVAVLKRNGNAVRFKSTYYDLYDSAGNIIFKGTKTDVKKYLEFMEQGVSHRRGFMAGISRRLRRNTKKFNRSRARKKGFNVKKSDNGTSPDFSKPPGDTYLYGGSAGRNSIVEVAITGARNLDFKQAWKQLDITDKVRQKEILKDYVWHHLDDLNAGTMKGTLQLVRRDAHEACITHLGSGKQFQDLIGLNKYK